MSIRTITALAIPVIFLACSGTESPTAPQAPAVDAASVSARQALVAQLESANITLDQATEAAIAANPGSQLREADLDGSGTEVRYEIELSLADGSVVEVHVDATTGEIIATFPEDDDSDDDDGDDDVAIDCTGAISALEAQEIAEAETAGTAVEVEIDDGCEFEVTVETATGFAEVEVAPDGSVREVESDDVADSDGDDVADSDGDEPDSDGDDVADSEGDDVAGSDDLADSDSDEPDSDGDEAAESASDSDD
jgi:uncharacterized membrane protein YkoI